MVKNMNYSRAFEKRVEKFNKEVIDGSYDRVALVWETPESVLGLFSIEEITGTYTAEDTVVVFDVDEKDVESIEKLRELSHAFGACIYFDDMISELVYAEDDCYNGEEEFEIWTNLLRGLESKSIKLNESLIRQVLDANNLTCNYSNQSGDDVTIHPETVYFTYSGSDFTTSELCMGKDGDFHYLKCNDKDIESFVELLIDKESEFVDRICSGEGYEGNFYSENDGRVIEYKTFTKIIVCGDEYSENKYLERISFKDDWKWRDVFNIVDGTSILDTELASLNQLNSANRD